jgi:hypothetical protein
VNRNLRTTARIIVAAAALGLSVTACTHGATAQQAEQAQQQADTSSLINDQPIPHFNYSQIRQTLIDAETISADGTQTTSFFFQMGDPDPVFTCPSLGMPVADTAQLSNPEQVVGVSSTIGGGSTDLPQMDPNGIYSPSVSSGTYVICVNSSGQKYLQYWEGDVMTVTSAATWDSTTHTIDVTGAPTAVIHTAAGK